MNFKLGDKVRFLNQKGEGIVNKLINKTTVGIIIDDFEIPVPIADLILIPDKNEERIPTKLFVSPSTQTNEQVNIDLPQQKQLGIYIAFAPENSSDIENSNMNVWFINHTDYQTLFTFSLLKNKNSTTIEVGNTKQFESVLIATINKKQIETLSDFKIDVLFFDDKQHPYQLPVSEIKKLKIVKLYKENVFEENIFIDENAYIISISKLDDVTEQKKSFSSEIDLSKITLLKKTNAESPKISKPNANNNPANEMEIDIHIQELIEDYGHLSNSEIIQIQLKHFQNALNIAIEGNYRKLVVIHGVGVGRLKQEVRNLLSAYDNLQVYDASFAKYGFGATEIIIN